MCILQALSLTNNVGSCIIIPSDGLSTSLKSVIELEQRQSPQLTLYTDPNEGAEICSLYPLVVFENTEEILCFNTKW